MCIHLPQRLTALVWPLQRLASLPLALLLGALPIALLLGLLAPGAAQAGGGTVSQCADESQLSALLAGGGAITFNCGPNPVTITVSAEKLITQPTSVDGGGLVTLSGGGATRLFSVTVGAQLNLANLTLSSGRANNDSGGAIYNQGRLFLLNSMVVSSYAATVDPYSGQGLGGGIFNAAGASLVINQSRFINNAAAGAGGGGLYSAGTLTVTAGTFVGNAAPNLGTGGGLQTHGGTALIADSTFLSNTAVFGGAIGNDGAEALTLINSLLAHNFATLDGGAIDITIGHVQTYISDTFAFNRAAAGDGGAVYNGSFLTIQSSVFYGNAAGSTTATGWAGGAIESDHGAITLTNSTLYNNSASYGGGIYSWSPVTFFNSTLFSNTAAVASTGGNLYMASGTATFKNTILANAPVGGATNNCDRDPVYITHFVSLGHNLESADTCDFRASGDLTDTDPLLGLLADNGGPTLTLSLRVGSPAIDHGDNTGCPATDQRGVDRPFNGTCDIGAYEFDAILAKLFLPIARK